MFFRRKNKKEMVKVKERVCADGGRRGQEVAPEGSCCAPPTTASPPVAAPPSASDSTTESSETDNMREANKRRTAKGRRK